MTAPPRRTVDLDAARQARAETVGPGPVVILGGNEYDLAPELPMDAILAIAEEIGNLATVENHVPDPRLVVSALSGLFGRHWETLRSELSATDCMFLLSELLELYGTDLPESSASRSS